MINIKYEDIINRIKKEANLSDEQIDEKIEEKLKELSGLISKEGAAHILANDLGIKLFEDIWKKRLKIQKLIPGMRNVEIIGKVIKKYEVRNFKTDKSEGKVGSFLIGDETGSMRVVIWGNEADKIQELNEEDIIKIKNGYVKDNNNFKEVHLNKRSELTINPEGEIITTVSQTTAEYGRKKIKDLKDRDVAEVLGTVVQVFEPRFFEACPECNRKVEFKETKFHCEDHGEVIEKIIPVMNLFFDDGTTNIRTVCFRDQVEMLLGLNENDLLELRDNPSKFEDIRNDILGKQIFVVGRVRKNDMFNRLEIVVQKTYEADPKEIAEALIKEVETN